MSIVKVYPAGEMIDYMEGDSLLHILRNHNIIIESPCGGKGTCGKCRVKVLDGEFNEPCQEEIKHLGEEIKNGIRLSCLVFPKGDVSIELCKKEGGKHKILAEGYIPDFPLNPVVKKKLVKLEKPSFENNRSYEEMLEKTIQCKLSMDTPEMLSMINQAYTDEKATIVYSGEEVIGVEKGDTTDKLYGAAIDIGTTTVVLSLVDMVTGKEVASDTCINPQKEYGLDVLSRIDFVKHNDNGLKLLQKAIVDGLNTLLENLCKKSGICQDNVYEFSIGANATMMHLLLGIDTDVIGKAPYATVFSGEKYIRANSIGLKGSKIAKLYCLPGVSSFIGADIVAGAMVTDLRHTKENILFIDIGTNGEIVLSKKGELYSCSCAAGPALEGANISCGMRAAEGAIEGVDINNDGIEIQVIGDEKPVGICGSGILDAISEIWKNKIMNKSGRLKKREDLVEEGRVELADRIIEEDKKRKFVICKGEKPIVITQEDIRQVQLAKGAISSGFYALLDLMDITMDDLDKVIIAGQFGKHLKISSLTGVGIIPEELKDKIDYVGNSSKSGAMMCLLSYELRGKIEGIARDIKYFELSTKEGYEKLFTKCLTF
ncbi:Uncharacterized 2Fe-2 and 4Fe-4S clusters-containing protein, contains DUF4445 domain [Hathewaya proteolytica DSM 3090]|uniref:Uncharacterized 2Fe-2 and 4Fe-4S clusters-containing protein, contains DUF4445 domain n=1 Tax=Hathewaya proteolytica DSM 3090 TaxID=1121331 RepID=A0A1M6MBP3_9CLOT|nr:ASKHA domain-containing protein [Hathewaya proteolytica]SHJ80928.1 Uncharacterized 2Fe-2 and 4Fe-4S clusters-containing protein, contains DUF4445 domain [Hathewaya proteolytica DSM 3090]